MVDVGEIVDGKYRQRGILVENSLRTILGASANPDLGDRLCGTALVIVTKV